MHLREGGEGLDFLGFHHRRVRGERGYRHLRFLARWPSREAMQRARNRVRELTGRKRALQPVEEVVREVNDYLRGWANYYRYGNSRLHFTKIRTYALKRLVLFAAKRHDRTSRYGWTVVNYRSRDRWDWSASMDSSSPPVPSGTGGSSGADRIPAVKDVGEPVRENRMHGSMWRREETPQSANTSAGASRRPDRLGFGYGDARKRARKEERAAGAGEDRRRARVAWMERQAQTRCRRVERAGSDVIGHRCRRRVYRREMGLGEAIDITFDFRSDTPPGKDPDARSPTLRRYHQLLWSKPLPSGAPFELDVTTPRVSAPPLRARRVLLVERCGDSDLLEGAES